MIKDQVKRFFQGFGIDLNRYDRKRDHYEALYLKYRDFTMVPQELFVLNLALLDQFREVKGCYVECGVWKGGITAAVAELMGQNRMLHLFDSFEGLPPAQQVDGPAAIAWQSDTRASGYHDNCNVNQEFALKALTMAGHSNFNIHKGWFRDTLPDFTGEIAMLRLDADWYESTMDCLNHLYPKVADKGLIVIDDYYTWDGCARAVHDFLSRNESPGRIRQFNNNIAYLIKNS